MPTPPIADSLRLIAEGLGHRTATYNLAYESHQHGEECEQQYRAADIAEIYVAYAYVAKNTGANIVYELTFILESTYSPERRTVASIMPARNAPVISATPKIASATQLYTKQTTMEKMEIL